MSFEADKIEVIDYIKRWGGSASDALFDPSCRLFSIPHLDGIIGYRKKSGCAVIMGDPACSLSDRPHLTQAFYNYCEARKMKILYVAASKEFKEWTLQNTCKASIEVGEVILLDPQADLKKGGPGSLLRRTVRHAANKGVTVHEYLLKDPKLEQEMEELGKRWVKARKGIQTYLSHIDLFNERLGRRWFYAKQNERLIGVIMLNQIQNGWLLNHSITFRDSPRGTSELLLTTAFEKLRQEGCRHFIAGIVPKKEPGEITGVGPIFKWFINKSFKFAMHFFRLEERRRYWNKFQPKTESSYVLFINSSLGCKEIYALMSSLRS